jgi:hypothetical protein
VAVPALADVPEAYEALGELALAPVVADERGELRLPACDPRGAVLRTASDAILPREVPLAELLDAGGSEPRLVVDRRAHLRVELAAPVERADAFEVLAADGRRLALVQLRAGCSHPTERARLHAGRSLVLTTSDAARTLALFRDGDEVARIPLALRTGELTPVHW